MPETSDKSRAKSLFLDEEILSFKRLKDISDRESGLYQYILENIYLVGIWSQYFFEHKIIKIDAIDRKLRIYQVFTCK